MVNVCSEKTVFENIFHFNEKNTMPLKFLHLQPVLYPSDKNGPRSDRQQNAIIMVFLLEGR